MKTIFSILIAIVLLSSSCEKEDSVFRNLEGKWVIKKILVDPGDGSGRYRDVSEKHHIEFFKDGSAKSSYSVFGLQMLLSFKVMDSVQVTLSFKDTSSQPSTPYRYNFSGDTLVLNPPCFEGCGLKLVRLN